MSRTVLCHLVAYTVPVLSFAVRDSVLAMLDRRPPQLVWVVAGGHGRPTATEHSPGYQKSLGMLLSSKRQVWCGDLPEFSGTRAGTGSAGTVSLTRQARGPDNPACYMVSPYHLATTTIPRPGSTSSRQKVEVPPGTWPPWMDPDSVPRPGLPWVSPPVENHAIQ